MGGDPGVPGAGQVASASSLGPWLHRCTRSQRLRGMARSILRRSRGACLLTCFLAITGCRSTSVATQNLDAVLGSNDQLRYRGDTTTVFRDVFASLVEEVTFGAGSTSEEATLDPIPNPTELGLENLILLARSRQGPDGWLHNEQVRVLTRYARFAPSQLLRERAFLELGAHAVRLDVPAKFVAPEEVATASELAGVLNVLVDATRSLLEDRSSDAAQAEFGGALARMAGTGHDIQGGTRILGAISPFLRGSGIGGAQKGAMEELAVTVQRRCVREALQAGLYDPSPVVRAAAMRAGIEAFGEPFLVECALALVPPAFTSDEVRARFGAFGVPSVPSDFVEVHIAVGEALARNGLPAEARGSAIDALELKLVLFSSLHFVAINDLLFPSRSRHAIMRSLGVLSGGELVTYREEEWDTWFQDRADQLGTELRRMRREAAGTSEAGSS